MRQGENGFLKKQSRGCDVGKVWEWIKSRPLRMWIVLIYFSILTIYASWWVFLLLFPIYWQVYLKKDLTPDWWSK